MTEAVPFEVLREHLNRPMSWAVWRNIRQMLDVLVQAEPRVLGDWIPYVEGSMRRHPDRLRFIGPWDRWLDVLLGIGQEEPRFGSDLRFSLVRGVYLEDWYCHANNRVIDALVQVASLDHLVFLDLRGADSTNAVDEGRWRMFVDAPHLQTLETVLLDGQPCAGALVEMLVLEPVLPNLTCFGCDDFVDESLLLELLSCEHRQRLRSVFAPELDVAMFGRFCQAGLRSLDVGLRGEDAGAWARFGQSSLRSLSLRITSETTPPPVLDSPVTLEHLSVTFERRWTSSQLESWAHALCQMLGSSKALRSLALKLPLGWGAMMPVFAQYDVWSRVESLSLVCLFGPTDQLLTPERWPSLRHLAAPSKVVQHALPSVTSLELPLGDDHALWSALIAHDVFAGVTSLRIREFPDHEKRRRSNLVSVFESMDASGLRRVDFDDGRLHVEEVRALVAAAPRLEAVDINPRVQSNALIETIGEYAASASLRYAFPAPFAE